MHCAAMRGSTGTRVARASSARAWVERIASEARRRDFAPCCEFALVDDAGHDFGSMVAAGMLAQFESFIERRTLLLSGDD